MFHQIRIVRSSVHKCRFNYFKNRVSDKCFCYIITLIGFFTHIHAKIILQKDEAEVIGCSLPDGSPPPVTAISNVV